VINQPLLLRLLRLIGCPLVIQQYRSGFHPSQLCIHQYVRLHLTHLVLVNPTDLKFQIGRG
jgi:hypothetical protein